MKNRQKKVIYPIALIVIGACIRAIGYFQNFTYRFRTDDFGTLIYPAYLAGYDWRSFFSGNNHYYGFGYYWIMAPLFKWIHSPRALLLAIAFVNGLMIVMVGCLTYHLLTAYCHMEHGWATVALALLSTLIYGNNTHERGRFWLHTDNEIPILLVVYLTVWALLAAHKAMKRERKTRCLHAFAVSLVLAWGLSVHERLLALVIAVVLVELFLFVAQRRWLLSPAAFFGSLGVGFFAERMIRNRVIRFFWLGGWPEKNTNAFKDASVSLLCSKTGIKSIITIFLGNMHAIFVKGYGVTVVSVALFFVWLWRRLKRKETIQSHENEGWPSAQMLVILIFGVTVAVTLAGLCVRWGVILLSGINDYAVSKGFKAVCYGRYYQAYLNPIIVSTLVLLYHNTKVKRSLIEGWCGLYAFFEIVFYAFIYQRLLKLQDVTGSTFINMSYGLYLSKAHGNGFHVLTTLFVTGAVLAMLTAAAGLRDGHVRIFAGYRIAGKHLIVAAAVFITMMVCVDRFDQVSTLHPSISFWQAEKTAQALTKLEEADLLPEHLYMPNHNWCFGVQFMNRELPFVQGSPSKDKLDEDNLIITSSKKDSYLDEGYTGYTFGDHWIYTNNSDTAGVLEEIEENA